MRKIMFLMALLMTATWMFTSCTDEENGDDGKIPPEEVPGTEEQQLIYSFVKERDALSSEVVIGIELKNIDGTNYIATEDIHLPFVFPFMEVRQKCSYGSSVIPFSTSLMRFSFAFSVLRDE